MAGGGGAKMAAALSVSGAGPGPGAEPPAGPGRAPEEDLPPLDPAEVRSRLEHSARQFRNRRKVLIRGLPADVSNQVRRGNRERREGGNGKPGTGTGVRGMRVGTGNREEERGGAEGEPGMGMREGTGRGIGNGAGRGSGLGSG